MEEIEKDLIA